MLVTIDESGDAGFRLDKGSTPVFAAAMVIFRDLSEAERTAEAIRKALVDLRTKPEFKFNRCSDRVRDGFFAAVLGFDFRVRALVVDKTAIIAPEKLGDRDNFYRHFVRAMIHHEKGALVDAKVIIDGSGDRSFQRDLRTAIRTGAPPGAIRDVQLRDSARVPLLQLADMCVGAIARAHRDERANADRWRAMLSSKIDDIWDFR